MITDSLKGSNSLWEITSKTDEKVQEKAVIDLIERLLQKRVAEFSIHVNQSILQADNKDKFIVCPNLLDEFITDFFSDRINSEK